MSKKHNTEGRTIIPSESRIQQDIVRWYRNQYCLKHQSPRSMIFSIPNEGRGMQSAALIATGLYAGMADLCVIHHKGNIHDGYTKTILFIEVKNALGAQGSKQFEFEDHCVSMGILYKLVRSLSEFRGVVEGL